MRNFALHAGAVPISENPELFAQVEEPQTHVHAIQALVRMFPCDTKNRVLV